MKKIKFLSICIITIMLLVAICPIATFAAESDMVTITFEDTKLAKFVYDNIISNGATSEEISLSENVMKIKQSVLNNVTSIETKTISDASHGFTSLVGLEKFVNLESLLFSNNSNQNPNSFNDLTPLKDLTKLKKITLLCDKITNLVDLKNLTNVTDLTIRSTELESLEGIENMKLKILSISIYQEKGKVSDLEPLKNSKDTLEYLHVAGNEIKDVSVLKDFSKLKVLVISSNKIESLDGILENNDSLSSVTAFANKITSIGKINSNANINSFDLKNQKITHLVSLKDADEEVTVDLPEILTVLADENHILYQGNASEIFDAEKGKISSDGKKITAKVADIKSGEVKVTVIAGEGKNITAKGTVVTFAEAFEVLGITKVPETENADKVKVTITLSKELDINKVPSGWILGEDKKSVSKEFDKNGKEDVVLTDKDGSIVKQTVEVSNIKEIQKEDEPKDEVKGEDGTTADTKIPKTGVNNTIIFIVGAIAIIGTVVFARSRKMLK